MVVREGVSGDGSGGGLEEMDGLRLPLRGWW